MIQAPEPTVIMSNLFWRSDEQMGRLKPFLSKSIRRPQTDRGTVFLRMGNGADASSLLDGVTAAARDTMGAALVAPGTTVMSV